jgi:excisionase family DNA binding protein
MASVSVAEAAKSLGVGVSRIHQRIADGSLRAERIGSQWVVDELSLLRVAERKRPGRPLSVRSAWAIIALAEGDGESLRALAPGERGRARSRLDALLRFADDSPKHEEDVRRVSSELRSLLRNRARRDLYKVAEADLPALREDPRWQSIISPAATGIASADLDGYVSLVDLRPLTVKFLLMPADSDANVVIHVLPDGQKAYPGSKLLLATDLAEQRGPREELRAAELLHEVAQERKALPTAGGTQALQRSEAVAVTVDGREGFVRRPNLLGALVVKAAAHGNAGDPGVARHRRDFVVLAEMITAADFAGEDLTRKDRQRLLLIVAAIKNDRELLLEIPGATAAIARLEAAASTAPPGTTTRPRT